MPGAPAALGGLAAAARAAGAEVHAVAERTGPPAGQWQPAAREVDSADLLRREPIVMDPAPMREAVAGAVVLITGAGGSIGGELARAVADLGPGRVVLLGRGGAGLEAAQRELARRAPGLRTEQALCDIRDPGRLRQVFQRWRPEVVLHAAAHKHEPSLEDCPEEAVATNIMGTRNVLEAALDHGVRAFVNLSSIRAVNPVSVLGVSKRIAEGLVAGTAAPGVRLASVRLASVLGSRGSVIPVFMDQIRRGGPVLVTHPDMARYFMTLREAAQLVLTAAALGGGQVFALDLGEPLRIAELARDTVRLAGFRPGADVEVRFSGLRPGEKLYEEVFTAGEERWRQVRAELFESPLPSRDPAALERGLDALAALAAQAGPGRQRAILDCFMDLVPTYRPSPTGLGRFLAGEGAGRRGDLDAIA